MMKSIEEIMEGLDWNMPPYKQKESIEMAKGISCIEVFIQPNTKLFNKNVWEGCAKILIDRRDRDLTPFLIPLLEWVQDENWPGFDLILNRLRHVEPTILIRPYSYCLIKAKETDDIMWIYYLSLISRDTPLFDLLSNEQKEIVINAHI